MICVHQWILVDISETKWFGMRWSSMPNPDTVRFRHMREAAAAALEMAGGRGRADVSSNLMLAMR